MNQFEKPEGVRKGQRDANHEALSSMGRAGARESARFQAFRRAIQAYREAQILADANQHADANPMNAEGDIIPLEKAP